MLNPIKIRSEELNKRVTIQRPVKVTNDRGVNLIPPIEKFKTFVRR